MKILGTGIAILVVTYDIIVAGSFCVAAICPFWACVALIRCLLALSPPRSVSCDLLVPSILFAASFINSGVQEEVAARNEKLVVSLCCRFKETNDRWPGSLADLVPDYCESVPRAKYCVCGRFLYAVTGDEGAVLWRLSRLGRPTLTTLGCGMTAKANTNGAKGPEKDRVRRPKPEEGRE